VVIPNPPLGVRHVDRWPEMIREGAPHGVVAVDRDRVLDAEGARLCDDVVDVALEAELRRMNADDGQAYFAAQARTYGSVRSQLTQV
jgi:hypothetical protein